MMNTSNMYPSCYKTKKNPFNFYVSVPNPRSDEEMLPNQRPMAKCMPILELICFPFQNPLTGFWQEPFLRLQP